ncbi:hypothetical protein ACSBR1_027673 [Camellia fascicularis]
MIGSDHVPDTRMVKFVVKSMIRKTHLVIDRVVKLRHKVADTIAQGKYFENELGRAKASLEIANANNAKLLVQLSSAKQERNALWTKVEQLKKKKKNDAVKEAEGCGFKEAEDNYTKQVEATKDIFF